MAYTPPPTFTDGQTASAAQLNVLRDDIQYLYAIAQSPNVAMKLIRTAGEWFFGPDYFVVRHKHEYLRYRIFSRWWTFDNSNHPNVRLEIYVANVLAVNINWFADTPTPTSSDPNGDGTTTKIWDTYIDLGNVVGFAAAVGQVYEIKLVGIQEDDGEHVPNTARFECTYIYESDSTI
jgi:hypothetical protein